MKLYIDTNIYLSYINPTSDIASLKKLKKLIKSKKVELVLTSQTKAEYLKHFKERVYKQKKKIEEVETKIGIPNELKGVKGKKTREERAIIKQIDSLNLSIKKYRAGKIAKLKSHIELIEKEIREMLEGATFFEYTDEIILKAIVRYTKGLPPRKNDEKYGDAVIWETLKFNIKKEELVIISFDSDFCDEKLKQTINPTLKKEWKEHSGKKIKLYPIIGSFINSINTKDPVSKDVIKNETTQVEILFNPSFWEKRIELMRSKNNSDVVNIDCSLEAHNNDLISGMSTADKIKFLDEDSSVISNWKTWINEKSKVYDFIDVYSPSDSVYVCKKCGGNYVPGLTDININNLCHRCNLMYGRISSK